MLEVGDERLRVDPDGPLPHPAVAQDAEAVAGGDQLVGGNRVEAIGIERPTALVRHAGHVVSLAPVAESAREKERGATPRHCCSSSAGMSLPLSCVRITGWP